MRFEVVLELQCGHKKGTIISTPKSFSSIMHISDIGLVPDDLICPTCGMLAESFEIPEGEYKRVH